MIYLAADRHGFETIRIVERYLKTHNLDCINVGVLKETEDAPLQEIIPKVVKGVLRDKQNLGILSCGTGIGVQIGANRFRGIRASLATEPQLAEWSRVYDKSNVLCLAGWGPKKTVTHQILKAWLHANYDGSKKRAAMFKEFDRWH